MVLPDFNVSRDLYKSAKSRQARPFLKRRSFLQRLSFLLGLVPAGGLAAAVEPRKASSQESGSPALAVVPSPSVRRSNAYRQLKTYLDSIPAIDTHAHLQPFDQLGIVETARGRGMNLFGIWDSSYYSWRNPLTRWKSGETFDDWWRQAKGGFTNARAISCYRSLLVAFQDLYGVDFNRITDEQARQLDRRIYENYHDQKWLYQVITERANIELEFEDPYWARLDLSTHYRFSLPVFNVTSLVDGPRPAALRSDFNRPYDDPSAFAQQQGLPLNSLDDYLVVIDRLFREAKNKGAPCLKSTLAYQRTLQFDDVPKDRAGRAFGRPRSELTPQELKDYEDFIMWRLVELSATYDIPFQIHTGLARIEGSNPLLLVNLIEAHPNTKFILFHGGFPWVRETAAIAFEFKNVWLDCNWLPLLNYDVARRTFDEWLDIVPSNHIMWGADCKSPEEIYGAAEFMRRCWAEVLAGKVDRGDLADEQARQIGRQVLRDNALELFPQLKDRLWKDKGPLAHGGMELPGGTLDAVGAGVIDQSQPKAIGILHVAHQIEIGR